VSEQESHRERGDISNKPAFKRKLNLEVLYQEHRRLLLSNLALHEPGQPGESEKASITQARLQGWGGFFRTLLATNASLCIRVDPRNPWFHFFALQIIFLQHMK
jgi:hypothetical protein